MAEMTHLTWLEEWENGRLPFLFFFSSLLLFSECIISLLWLKPKPQHPFNYTVRMRKETQFQVGKSRRKKGSAVLCSTQGSPLNFSELIWGFLSSIVRRVVFGIIATFSSSSEHRAAYLPCVVTYCFFFPILQLQNSSTLAPQRSLFPCFPFKGKLPNSLPLKNKEKNNQVPTWQGDVEVFRIRLDEAVSNLTSL